MRIWNRLLGKKAQIAQIFLFKNLFLIKSYILPNHLNISGLCTIKMQVYHRSMKCCTKRKSLLYYQPISSAYLKKYYTVINFASSLLTCINLRKAVFKENKSFVYYKHLCSLMFKIGFPTAFKVRRLKTMIARSENYLTPLVSSVEGYWSLPC